MINGRFLPIFAILVLCSCAVQRAQEQASRDKAALEQNIFPIFKNMVTCVKAKLVDKDTQSCVRSAILENSSAQYPPNMVELKTLTTNYYEKVYGASIQFDSGKLSREDYLEKQKTMASEWNNEVQQVLKTTIEDRYRVNAGLLPQAKP